MRLKLDQIIRFGEPLLGWPKNLVNSSSTVYVSSPNVKSDGKYRENVCFAALLLCKFARLVWLTMMQLKDREPVFMITVFPGFIEGVANFTEKFLRQLLFLVFARSLASILC